MFRMLKTPLQCIGCHSRKVDSVLKIFQKRSVVSLPWRTSLNVAIQNKFPKYYNCATFHSSRAYFFHEDRETKALKVLDNVKQIRNSPKAALIIGFAGLIPFVAAPAYIISSGLYLPTIAYVQLAYGASILSFIGGVRWGLTLPEGSTQSPDWHNLGYSVMPSVVAWLGLLGSPTVGIMTVIGGLALSGYMDIAMWGYPNWFKGMRFCLTFIAILSLWTTFMCRMIMITENSSKEKEKLQLDSKP